MAESKAEMDSDLTLMIGLRRKSRRCCRNIVHITKLNILFVYWYDFDVFSRVIGNVEKHIRTTKHEGKVGSNALSRHPVQHFFPTVKI